jgi:hypothetical protein
MRQPRLARWLELNDHLYLGLADNTKVRATWDPRQVGDTRLSSVQYLKFDTGGRCPRVFGCDHPDPELAGEVVLSDDQQMALTGDLEG